MQELCLHEFPQHGSYCRPMTSHYNANIVVNTQKLPAEKTWICLQRSLKIQSKRWLSKLEIFLISRPVPYSLTILGK